MTESDLIALVPWLIFAAALAAICIQLRWPRRPIPCRRSEPGTRAPAHLPDPVTDANDPPSWCGQAPRRGRPGAGS